jgi:hypothetical protein
VAFHLYTLKKFKEIIINNKSTLLYSMISKTTKMMLIIPIFSFLGLTVSAGVSQTAFAQSIAEEAVEGTAGEEFFDGEGSGDSIGGGGGTADGTGAGGGIGDCQTC